MVTASIAERVAAGVAWLDANVSDWLESIELGRLDIGDCEWCALGQLFGSYRNAPSAARFDDAPPLGFQAYDIGKGYRDECDDLNVEWVRVIEERRAQTAGAS